MVLRRAAVAGLAFFALIGAADPGAVVNEPLDSPVPVRGAGGLGANGLRVRIAPSFSENHYAIDFAPQPRDCITPHGGTADEVAKVEQRFCRDVLVTYALVARPRVSWKVATGRWTFHIPVSDYRELVEGIDARLDKWRGMEEVTSIDPKTGETTLIIVSDGTSVGLERIRDGRVRSVVNNLRDRLVISNPASFAKSEVQRLLLIYGPSGKVPRDGDWNINSRSIYPDDPCAAINDFVVPDPDGYGVGNDPCARALRGGSATSGPKKKR